MASVNIQQLDICSTKAAVIVQWSINKPLKSLILTSLKQDIHFFCFKDKKGSYSWLKRWIRTFSLSLPSFCGASTSIFFSDLKRALVQRKRKPPTIWQTERDVF